MNIIHILKINSIYCRNDIADFFFFAFHCSGYCNEMVINLNFFKKINFFEKHFH